VFRTAALPTISVDPTKPSPSTCVLGGIARTEQAFPLERSDCLVEKDLLAR